VLKNRRGGERGGKEVERGTARVGNKRIQDSDSSLLAKRNYQGIFMGGEKKKRMSLFKGGVGKAKPRFWSLKVEVYSRHWS